MTHYDLIARNKQKSWFVVASFIGFIAAAAYLMTRAFGYGLDVVGIALIGSGVASFASYWWSDSIILSLSKARPVTRAEFFDFYTVTENLVASQRMPQPKLYAIDDTALNAFATGRDPQHAAVVATTGLLQTLDRAELEGVIAHELSHVQNYDIRLMSIVTILVGMIALLSDLLLRWSFLGNRRSSDRESNSGQIEAVLAVVGVLLALLSPIIAQLIQLAISRKREFLADASAVGMTKNPQGLANALKKLSQDREPLEVANKATAHLFIADPLKNRKDAISWFSSLFQTHPPVTERIAALQQLTGSI